MRKVRFDGMNCSLARALDEIGDWWTLLVLREITLGNQRFEGIRAALGIARNILSERLAGLIDHRILHQVPAGRGSRRYAYMLTTKGEALLPSLVALMQWGDRWISGRSGAPIRVVEAATGNAVGVVRLASRTGQTLHLKDVRFVPGPGAHPGTIRHLASLDTPDDASSTS